MLRHGACIGFFTPSSPATVFAKKRFERACDFLESKGFRLKAGSLTGRSDHYRSGPIKARVDEFNALIRDPEVDCIMSTIGGSEFKLLLPYIDYESFCAHPKPVIGYSDATAILLALYAKTGITTFYGPALVASFGEFSPFVDQTFEYFADVLLGEKTAPYALERPQEWTDEFIDWATQDRGKKGLVNTVQFIGSGQVQGRLMGGNLNTMSAIWGSQYMPDIKPGDILLIEDSLKDIATVERLLAMLKLNGVFDQISALLVGKHEGLKDLGTGRTTIDVLNEVLNGQDLPIVYDFDCSHTHPMYTLPIGGQIKVDFDQERVSLLSVPFPK